MASSYLWTGTWFMATFRLRRDTYQMDPDIARDAAILKERMLYEERHHDGASREESIAELLLEDN